LAERRNYAKAQIAWANRLHAAEQRAESAEVMLKEARLNEHALQSQSMRCMRARRSFKRSSTGPPKTATNCNVRPLTLQKLQGARRSLSRTASELAEAPALFGFAVEPEAPDLAYLKVQVDRAIRDYIGFQQMFKPEAARIGAKKRLSP